MEIRSLQDTPISILTSTFNLAFSDYIVKFNATEEYLANRWRGARINYEFSFGCFEEDQLVGFIMHGYDPEKQEVFNCATGVVPAHRGKRIVQLLYDHALPVFRNAGVKHASLEVIKGNDKAIKAYERVGYSIERTLACFKGNVQLEKQESAFAIMNFDKPNWEIYTTFWDIKPSWELGREGLSLLRQDYRFLEARLGERCVGYMAFEPKTSILAQIAVDPAFRRKGVARQLVTHLPANQPFRALNIDFRAESCLSFFKNIGLENYIDQYEMRMKL